jgi:crotonobetainyl-CoA:carnitine CoA-transferase CaiB-like acyl-CoA transferase
MSALAGLRILELADETGAYCGKLLADLGADVIRIEPPGGDATRLCRRSARRRARPRELVLPRHERQQASLVLDLASARDATVAAWRRPRTRSSRRGDPARSTRSASATSVCGPRTGLV